MRSARDAFSSGSDKGLGNLPVTISLEKLSVSYDEKLIVDNFSFKAKAGTITALIAPSGAGKTTILSAISGLLPSNASYFMKKFDYFGSNFDNFRKTEVISFVFQNPIFFEWKTIKQSILQFQILSRSNAIDIDDILDSLNIGDIGNLRPSQLSRGMLYRASLARAMSINSKLLFLDESFSNIDEIQKINCLEAVKRWVSDRQAICIFVTHQIADAVSVADKIMILSQLPLRHIASIDLEKNVDIRSVETCIPIIDEIRSIMKNNWGNNQ